MYTKSLKTMLIVAVAAAVVAGILPPTYSTPTFSDIETGSGVFVAGELDLELDGNNPHSGPLIDIADAAAGATYHRDIELHLAGGSNPANTSLCFTKVQSASTGGNGGGEAGVVHPTATMKRKAASAWSAQAQTPPPLHMSTRQRPPASSSRIPRCSSAKATRTSQIALSA